MDTLLPSGFAMRLFLHVKVQPQVATSPLFLEHVAPIFLEASISTQGQVSYFLPVLRICYSLPKNYVKGHASKSLNFSVCLP